MVGKSIYNYKILSLLGEGGMGKVYLAQHNTLDRKVAIKVLNPELLSNYDIKERFINEAKILSKLNHNNIIAIHDFINIDNGYFIIMEYADGIPINKLLKSVTGPIPEKRCLKIFTQILSAFSYAHKKDIVHRDIKPSNLILLDDETPKVLDFGIAKIMQNTRRITKTGMKLGSIYYMSPEQVLGQNINFKSDIYSLGITLFEMLTAKLPYDEDTQSDYLIQEQIVKQPLPLVRSYYPNISEHTELIIKKATEKDSDKRFYDTDEFLNEVKISEKNLSHQSNKIDEKTIIKSPVPIDVTQIYNYQEQSKNKIDNNNIIICENCSSKIELDDNDLNQKQFLCPVCNVINLINVDGTKISIERKLIMAGFWLRTVAIIIDSIILYLVMLIFSLPFVFINTTSSHSKSDEYSSLTFLIQLMGIVITWLYDALSESGKNQATIGKRAVGIKVTDISGNKISFGRATGRHFAKILSSFILLIGYIMAAFTKKKQALHDLICNTLVIKK